MTQNQLTDWRGLLEDLVEEMNALSAHLEGTTPLETVLSGLRAWNRARAALAADREARAGVEVGELVAWLCEEAVQAANSDAPHSAGMLTWAAQVVGEHADLLERQAAPVPVAVETGEGEAR